MTEDNWLQKSSSIKDLLVAFLCLLTAFLLFTVCCIGSCAVVLRCCPCLCLLVPLTFGSAILLLSMGLLGDQLDIAIDSICDVQKDDIRAYFNRVVDQPMCSDMCPCEDDAFVAGNYSLMTEVELASFGRAPFTLDGDPEQIMLTRSNLDT